MDKKYIVDFLFWFVFFFKLEQILQTHVVQTYESNVYPSVTSLGVEILLLPWSWGPQSPTTDQLLGSDHHGRLSPSYHQQPHPTTTTAAWTQTFFSAKYYITHEQMAMLDLD